MPEVTKEADPEFFKKLTEDTLSTNDHLKEYYDQIETIYNAKSEFLPGQDPDVADHEATSYDQGSESDVPFHNDKTYNIFLSKFTDALGKLLDHYDNSSLLQHDHKKQCVYFKYWFYDKIIKNILSDGNLHDFYKEIKGEDEEDESFCEAAEEKNSKDTGKLKEIYFEKEEEEEEEEIVEASPEDIDEDYMSEDENQHICEDEECCNKKILLSLGKSNICNIYKLKLNQIRDIKLLYDYLENGKSKNISSIKDEISKSTYCSSFNKTIELYNEKSKCRIDDFDNGHCQEVEDCKKTYPHTNVHVLECAKAEPTTGSPQRSSINNELQEATNALSPTGLADSSDSTTSFPSSDVSHVKSENPQGVGFIYLLIPSETADFVLTTQHTCDDIGKKHCLGNGEQVVQSDQLHTATSPLRDMGESHTTTFTSSTSCPHGNGKEACDNSSQPQAVINRETTDQLNKLRHEHTVDQVNPHMVSQEENGNTNTIVSSASSVLGVSALAFMLYKFTPLGSLINNRRGGMDTWDINEEGYDENLLFSSALGNTNSNNNNYSIGYYSLGNTQM
ncbi:PIR Superfamily Protein [Plasmodium ovale curtisi]|uniref:PIR Superfamily Protein n=1 Tax=Plasmodium ovale curtisi TaxID=864141 RepID=A0A1A8WAF3_PLAOA|nr:PIR Superfamily Protein [Plasmodium ovale curtisi]